MVSKTRPPSGPGRPAWPSCSFGFMSITTEALPMGLLPQLSAGLGVSESGAGLLVALYAFVIMMVTLPIAARTAHWPQRRLLLVITAVFVLSNLLLAAAPSYAAAVIARLIAASVHGVLWSALPACATCLVPAERTGRAVAVVFASNTAALAFGVPLGTAVGNALSWRSAFVLLAVVAVLLLVAAPVLLPETSGAPATRVTALAAFKLPGVLTITVATTLVMLGHFSIYAYISPYLQHIGVSEAGAGPVLLVFGLAGVVGVWSTGVLVDRRPRGATLVFTGALALVFAALAVTGKVTTLSLVLVVIWGLLFAGLPALLQSAALTAAPQAQAAVSALYVIGVNFSIGGGSIAGGQVLNRLGVAALPLLAAVSATASWFIIAGAHRHAFPRRPITRAAAQPEQDSDDSTPRDVDDASLAARTPADTDQAGDSSLSCPEQATMGRCD
ncbi:MFS transporter [Streptomyces kasugaensis]|uniref:MFS transporter n=2 Tax=Streptomyces kasugaensis TaxID=1946 RepID=A0A4Q9HX06_STRKA|nr:MFS transporter [Streptomyces kasugaensis]